MRGHAHIDTKRREPWLFDHETTALVRTAIRKRYELLPLWYTLFHEHERSGLPVMRPIWYDYPKDKSAFAIEDEFMLGKKLIYFYFFLVTNQDILRLLGDSLLVHPVTGPGVTEVSVYFPGESQLWYDLDALELFSGHGTKKVQTPKHKVS
jgi:mannosyl-oligosaccharide alpha-1,3-glucosidase